MASFEENVAISLAMHCDENKLSLEEGRRLAERAAEAVTEAAEDRRAYLPTELLDDPEDSSV